jgi:flagellar hook assembly protein FlgD
MRAGTSFLVTLPTGVSAGVEIVSITGREVRRIEVARAEMGREIAWDGTDGAGGRVPAGVYFVRLLGVPDLPARKLIVVR